MRFWRSKPSFPPVLGMAELEHPIQLRAKDLEIDRLVSQAEQLTGELQETVTRLTETLRTHEYLTGDTNHDRPADL